MHESPLRPDGRNDERTIGRDPNRFVTGTIFVALSMLGLLLFASVFAGQLNLLTLVAGIFGVVFLMLGIRAFRARITISSLGVTGYSDSYTHRVAWGEIAEVTTQPDPGKSITTVTAILTSGKRIALMKLTSAKRPLANEMLRELQREVALRSAAKGRTDTIIRRSGLNIGLRVVGILSLAIVAGMISLMGILLIANDPCQHGGCGTDLVEPSSARSTAAIFVFIVTGCVIVGGAVWAVIRLSVGKSALRIMGLVCVAVFVISVIGIGIVKA